MPYLQVVSISKYCSYTHEGWGSCYRNVQRRFEGFVQAGLRQRWEMEEMITPTVKSLSLKRITSPEDYFIKMLQYIIPFYK